MADVLLAFVQTFGAIKHGPAQTVPRLAKILPALDAVIALAARRNEREHHVVARLGVGYARPHLFHDARSLMS